MKTWTTYLFWLCILSFWLSNEVFSKADSPKVAIIADPSLADLADLTAAQLSAVPDLSILERSDLDKVGHEQALKDIVGNNDLTAINFIPADGLIIMHEIKQQGKTGIYVRLVATQPGIVLRETALSDNDSKPVEASEIAKYFAPYWPKLAQIQQGKINGLSLLGLRFELDSVENRETERKINTLLASRLSAEPNTVVLERWRLNDAAFEKSLNAQSPTPFWTGSSLIDGSITQKDNQIGINLRLRTPDGHEISISDQDSREHLADLAARLADKIQGHPSTPNTWQPASEATHFARLGTWCLDNGLPDQGAAAIESALALGDDSIATHRQQIRAYASLAYTDELADAGVNFIPEAPIIAPESIPDRVKWAGTATNLVIRYNDAHPDLIGTAQTEDNPVTVSLPVLNNALRLLRFAYYNGYAWDHADEITDLRHTVQKLISQIGTLLGTRTGPQHDLFLTYQVRYAPFWQESPEATIAFYRDLLNKPNDGKLIRTELFEVRYFSVHPSVLPPDRDLHGTGPIEHPSWFSASPRIISWEKRPLSELDSIWSGFQDELKRSPDPVLQADALKFAIAGINFNVRNGDQNGTELVNFLQQNQDAFYGPRSSDFLTGFTMTFSDIVHSSNKANRDSLRALGNGLLQKQSLLPLEWVKQMPDLYYKSPSDEAAATLSRLQAYHHWYQTQVPQNPELSDALDTAERSLKAWIQAPSQIEGGSLAVTRHWLFNANPGPGAASLRSMIFSPSLITAENKVWFMMFGGREVHCVDPANFQSDTVYTVPNELLGNTAYTPGGCCLAVSPQYLVVAVFGKVLLCSRTASSWSSLTSLWSKPANTWRVLDLPPSDYKPCWIDGQLYLLYDVESDLVTNQAKNRDPASAVSGLIHVSLPDGGIENLVSTRRIPPQSPLDGKPLGNPIDLWKSPAGLMMAVHGSAAPFQIFGATAGKNDWAVVSSDPVVGDVKPGTDGELVGKGFDGHTFVQVALMKGKESEVLLSNSSVANDASAARWNTPEDVRNIPPSVISQESAVMRGDDLCLYRNVMNPTNDEYKTYLYYFPKGQKDSIRITLTLPPPTDSRNPLAARRQAFIYSFQSLHATDYGLVLGQALGGFWVIPWTEIDSLRQHPQTATAAAETRAGEEAASSSAPASVGASVSSTGTAVHN